MPAKSPNPSPVSDFLTETISLEKEEKMIENIFDGNKIDFKNMILLKEAC